MSPVIAQVPAAPPAIRSRPDTAEDIRAAGAVNTARRIEFISFAIGDDQYGVDIMAVREIKGLSNVPHLPKQPDYARGVMVPIVDLRRHFGEGLTENTPLHIVIIVQIDGDQIGLIGDRLLDIVSVDASHIQQVPRTAPGATADFLAGLVTHDNTMTALIDLPNLLADAKEIAA